MQLSQEHFKTIVYGICFLGGERRGGGGEGGGETVCIMGNSNIENKITQVKPLMSIFQGRRPSQDYFKTLRPLFS